MNPLKHMAVGGIHVQACQGDSSRDFEWEDADFCNFSGRTSKRTPFTGARGRPTAIALDNTNMSSSHSLAAGPLASSFRTNRNCNCCRFSSWQAFGLTPPSPVPRPSSLFVAVLRDGRTGRKVNRPQRQVEVKLKSAAAGDATGDDKPGRVLDKQAGRQTLEGI